MTTTVAAFLPELPGESIARAGFIILHSIAAGLALPIVRRYSRLYRVTGGAVPLHVALVGLGLLFYIATAVASHIVLFTSSFTAVMVTAPIGAVLTIVALSVMLVDLARRQEALDAGVGRRSEDKARTGVGWTSPPADK